MPPERDLAGMLSGLAPRLEPGVFVFCTMEDGARAGRAIEAATAMVRESESLSLVLPAAEARRLGFRDDLPMRCITLEVNSALDGVGLTAAVATALAGRGIACNVVAGFYHDHLFVPACRAREALDALAALAPKAAEDTDG